MKSFLPEGFEKLETRKPYINISKLSEGEHKYRIVQRPIAGWLDWENNKPKRYRPDKKPKAPFNPEKPIKAFWALYVWDYENEGLYVMEITQNGIRRALEEYAQNEDWGDLTSFDIKIKKEGAGKETKYTVMPIPHKPMNENILLALKHFPARLEALYEGKDPWNDLESADGDSVSFDDDMTQEQAAKLDDLLYKLNDSQYQKQLEDHLQITSIYNMNVPRDFDRTIRALEKKLKEREVQSA